MSHWIESAFLLLGVGAIVLPWIGLRRTGRDVYRVLAVLASVGCGWNCVWIVASWFVDVMPSYFFLANPLLFAAAVVLWFCCGAHGRRKNPS